MERLGMFASPRLKSELPRQTSLPLLPRRLIPRRYRRCHRYGPGQVGAPGRKDMPGADLNATAGERKTRLDYPKIPAACAARYPGIDRVICWNQYRQCAFWRF